MRRLFSVPICFLVIAAVVGVLLRWHILSPLPGIVYGNWLHAHSHVMFLGWVFNFFNLVFLLNSLGNSWKPIYKILFWLNQALLVGMLVMFPLQGYGAVTIPLSILHTLATGWFCVRFIRDTRPHKTDLHRWFAMVSLVLFLVSSLGPFALGPIMAHGLGQSKWYYFAIYFYLHFQYNGVFLFGVLSVLTRLFTTRHHVGDKEMRELRKAGLFLLVACFPAYSLSLLWSQPPTLLYFIGFGSAVLQLIALYFLVRVARLVPWKRVFHQRSSRILIAVAALSFAVKLVLQLISAFPAVAQLAYEVRPYVIAYLHLVLIGTVTLPILVWYIESGLMPKFQPVWVALLLVGFAASEVIMVWLPQHPDTTLMHRHLFAVSCVMFIGFAGFLSILLKRRNDLPM